LQPLNRLILFFAITGLFFIEKPEVDAVEIFQDDWKPNQTQQNDTLPLIPSPRWNQKYQLTQPSISKRRPSPFILSDSTLFKREVELDTAFRLSFIQEAQGIPLRPPVNISFDEYRRIAESQQRQDYFRKRSAELDGQSAVSGRGLLPYIPPSPFFDRVFGGSNVDIIPNGFLNLDFGGRWQRIDNPSIPIRQQRNGGFEFGQNVSMSLQGRIGEKLNILANFDNQNVFEFQNNLKVEYTGFDEDIIKKIEIGNVSMPVQNSLMTGASNLFGVKTQMQFGKLFFTGVAATLRGSIESIEIMGGAQGAQFELRASDYDENRHFFLGHFFEKNFSTDKWLRALPQVVSGVNLTRIEVYIINRQNNTQNIRNVVGFMDLGEGEIIYRNQNPRIGPGAGDVPTGNQANKLFSELITEPAIRQADLASEQIQRLFNLEKGIDYENVNGARRLSPEEFFFNPQLGFVSLFRRLQNDEMLAVAYEYTYQGVTYKVGELSEDYLNRPEDQTIILKLLRPTRINPTVPTWPLMMKNVYNLNASQISRENFQLRVIYRDDNTGLDNPSLHEGINTKDIPLVELLGADRLNPNNDPVKDGIFDYVEGITINPERGFVIFPNTEPFGKTLRDKFDASEASLIDKYVFDTLYSTTKIDAELFVTKNKFFLKGSFSSGSGSEIQLPGLNVAPGSVRVLAGNTPLTEGVDYTIDYFQGRVTILNEGILQSGKPIRIDFEKSDVFNFQSRSMFGGRFDYRVNERINLGATLLHLNERPLISRINTGNETVRNTQWGLDFSLREESNFLTRVIDAIPTVSTREKSLVNFNAEFAQLLPGTSNFVGGEGTSYIDDFESAITPFSLGLNTQSWKLASTPRTSDNRFDLSNQSTTPLGFSYKRAKLAWYSIDNIFYRTGGTAKPGNITPQDLENHYVRAIRPQEIFKQLDRDVVNPNLQIFDLAFFPRERGMYNYNPNLDQNGLLLDPKSNWGGISRAITTEVDFDKVNIEYLEFWMMDPFIQGERGKVIAGYDRDGNPATSDKNNTTGGKLYINLGNVSEDVMKDGRHAFENGLSPDYSDRGVLTNAWGRVTSQLFLTPAFDNNPAARANQDVGLDGLKSEDEVEFFNDVFISKLNVNSEALQKILADPSADKFRYYLGDDLDAEDMKILERYKNFNGMEGNSPVQINTNLPYTPSGTNLPDNEDLNADNTISDAEDYYEYKIDLKPGQLRVGQNYIVDEVTNVINGDEVKWYLFRVPVRQPDRVQGSISGFKSIRFMRTYLTGWEDPVVLRMAKMQMVGSQWRIYNDNLFGRGLFEIPEPSNTRFTLRAVNIEENGEGGQGRSPYVVPPGIRRDRDNTTVIERRLNEQSIELCVEDLQNNDARAVFKNLNLDLLQYGRLKMFFHAESQDAFDNEVTAFIRLGTDFDQNYYEIELPMKMTPGGARSPREIWPEENEIDFPLEILNQIKSNRNRQGISLLLPYSELFDKYRVTVAGRPDISDVQTIMIGIRNPDTPDGRSKSVCIWANELRVSDFNTTAGWAGNARLSAQLADVGNISATLRHSTFGFGSVQDKIPNRAQEENTQYDISGSFNLEKFLPGNTGIRIPLFASIEEGFSNPFYDPLDPDVPLSQSLNSLPPNLDRQNYRRQVQERLKRKSLSLTNVGKVKTREDAIDRFYDIENFVFGFNISDQLFTNANTEAQRLKMWSATGLYNFNFNETSIEPFKNIEALSKPWLRGIQELNFSPIPSTVTVRGALNRTFRSSQFRNADLNTESIEANYEKLFLFNRNYDMVWDLTRSLQLQYTALANAIVDEPEGEIDTKVKRDSIWNNLKNFGRMKNFNQAVNLTYQLPLNQLPATDWISATTRYTLGYNWTAGSILQADSLGNIAGNRRERSLNGKLDFVSLYNKNARLRSINSPPARGLPSRPGQSNEEEKESSNSVNGLLRVIMSLKAITFNISENEGTVLPGFLPSPSYFGMDEAFRAPGFGFIMGSQDLSILNKAAENGWIGQSQDQTNPIVQFKNFNMNLTADVEPFRDFRITLRANKRQDENYREIFRRDSTGFSSFSPNRFGSYRISFIGIRTAFGSNDDDNVSELFRNFEGYRSIIQSRMQSQVQGGEFGLNSQDVLIPAFIAALTGKNPEKVDLNPFPKFPLPNWGLDYRGLSRLPALQELFASINISHRYESSYDIGNFNSSLVYQDHIRLNNPLNQSPFPNRVNDDNFLIPLFVMNNVVVSERFSPLIGIDVRTHTRLNINIEYRQERNLGLSLSNAQVTEINRKDFLFDIGYTKTGAKIPFKIGGINETLENDLTFNMGITIGDTRTYQRQIDNISTITNGNLNFQLRPNIGYVVNQKLNTQLYFERVINEPRISNSFKRASTAFGVNLRYSLD
jgi:cell surface protein SprA